MPRVQIELPSEFPFETEIAVRISDTNYGGHLGNDALLALIHEARVRFFSAMGFSELDVGGRGIIMADSSIQYRSEAFQGERLKFEVAATDFNKYGCDIVYRVTETHEGRLVAYAKTGIVFFDYQARSVQPMPSVFARAVTELSILAA